MEVEDAILGLLEPLKETPGAKTIAAFQGQPGKDTWARLRRGFPAVLVLYAGSPAFTPSGRRLEERMEFEVYVMDNVYLDTYYGPSPHMWGLLLHVAVTGSVLRSIPTCAGFTACSKVVLSSTISPSPRT